MRNSRRMGLGRVACVALALVVSLSMTSCGLLEHGVELVKQATSGKSFVGREARDASEVTTYVKQALALAKERNKAVDEKKEEGDLAGSVAEDLREANKLYKDGQYENAAAAYEDIIDKYSLSLGANVNLTLALLQQEKNDDAFVQALSCVSLFKDEKGVYLNAQAAGVACGFSSGGVEKALAKLLEAEEEGVEGEEESDASDASGSNSSGGAGSASGSSSSESSTSSSGSSDQASDEELEADDAADAEIIADALMGDSEYGDYWKYNRIWSDIETELHGSPEKPKYDELRDGLRELVDKTGDEDAIHLDAYLDAVGVSLGFEEKPEEKADDAAGGASSNASSNATSADATSANSGSSDSATDASDKKGSSSDEGTNELPHVVVLSDVCNITLAKVEFVSSTKNIRATFDIVNKSDETLVFEAEGEVYDADEVSAWECTGGSKEIGSEGYAQLVVEYKPSGKDDPAYDTVHLVGNVVGKGKPDEKSTYTQLKAELDWTGAPTKASK